MTTMMTSRGVLAAGAAAAVAILGLTTAALGRAPHAEAAISTPTSSVGWARLVEDATGRVHVSVHVEGLSPGRHGIHIHTTGLCEGPAFLSAGGHFNPGGGQHGLENSSGPHAGDLPNLEVNTAGIGHLDTTTDRVTIAALLAGDGSALVIHAFEDDQVTNPTGNSGGRLACGVIAAD